MVSGYCLTRYCRRNVSLFVMVTYSVQNGIVNIYSPNSGDKIFEEEVINLKQKLLCKILAAGFYLCSVLVKTFIFEKMQ